MMIPKNPEVDNYLKEGCGRCELGGTPECKVHNWPEELVALRKIALKCGLVEELKWGVPCYTFEKKNILNISALKNYCVMGFFKGSLLKDPKNILVAPGENSQAVRMARFTNVSDIIKNERVLKSYIHEAVELEKAGAKIKFKDISEIALPEELKQKLAENAKLKNAFENLTPGRQRGYILHFSQPKQPQTRLSRIDKCTPKILEGKGFHDR